MYVILLYLSVPGKLGLHNDIYIFKYIDYDVPGIYLVLAALCRQGPLVMHYKKLSKDRYQYQDT